MGARALRPRAGGDAFLVGAALLLRRRAVEEVGGFDPDFFMFGEEVDLCVRMQRAGWRVRLCSDAVFVHVGGGAARQEPAAMYREAVRGHLRVLSKRDGLGSAESARRFLRVALRMRGLLVGGESRSMYRETASWLGSGDVRSLLAARDRISRDRTAGSEDRTSDSAG
jgi:GT2 family glycosyltransferase